MQTMTDMVLTDEERKDLYPACTAVDIPMQPQYPYGLRITLTGEELEKLGLGYNDAEVGGMVHGHFMARVTSCSEDKRQDGSTSCRVEMQIEALTIESEDAENDEEEAAEAPKPKRRAALYGKSD